MEINSKTRFKNLLSNLMSRKYEAEKVYTFLLEKTDFFTAPASTKYHGSYAGGLVEHSLAVYENLITLYRIYKDKLPQAINADSLIIVSLLHDICKINFYKLGTKNVKNEETGQWQKEQYYFIDDQIPLGHGEKSVIILQSYINLTADEIYAIRWHMGGFDDTSRSWAGGMTLSAAFEKCPLAVLLHMADLAANYINKE